MNNRKILGILLFIIGVVLFAACEKDKTLEFIECEVQYSINDMAFTVGDKLEINDLKVTPKEPTSGLAVTKVEYFLGNRLLYSTTTPPYSLEYTIPELPIGQHLLQIDVHVSATDYTKTTIWLKQYINIYEK